MCSRRFDGPACALATVLVLLVQGSAFGANRSRAVLDLIGTEGEETSMTRLRESFGAGFHADEVPLDTLTDAGVGPWRVSPPGQLLPCVAEPRSLDDIRDTLADIEKYIDDLEYDTARAQLDDLDAALCACSEPLDPAMVLRAPYLRGIAEFYSDDRETARSSFRHAAALVDKLEWDTAFSPEPQQVFLLGVGDAIQAPRATVLLPLDERPIRLILDGHEIDGGTTEISMGEGRHVVQMLGDDGQLTGATLDVPEAGSVTWFGPAGLARTLESTPEDAAAAPAFAAVAEAAARAGYTEIVVLNDPAWDRCWWFNVIDGVWKPITLTAGARLRAARNHKAAGGALAGTGGALIATGAILAVSQAAAMEELRPEMETYASSYALHIDEYESRRTRAGLGIGLLAAGGAALTTGLLLLVRGKAIQHETAVDPRLTVVATPEGAWFGLAGTF